MACHAIAGFHAPRTPLSLLLIVLALLLGWGSVANAAGEGGARLRGAWQSLDDEGGHWTAFEPARLERIARQSAPARVRLWVEDGAASAEPMLVVLNPGMERLSWVSPRSGEPVEAALLHVQRVGWLGHGRIAFELESLPSADAPIELVLEQQSAVNGRIAFGIGSRSDVLADDAAWIALVSTCLALLAGMALIALVFFVRMRDRTFLYYAGYLLAYGLVQLIQTGFAGSPLGWTWVAEAPRTWGRVAVLVTIVTSVLFLVHFAQIKHFLPRAIPWLRAYVGLVAVLGGLGFLPWTVAALGAAGLANPLIILGGPLVLAVAWFAWRRGSRYAGFFLVGWTPLLLVTVAGSFQLYGLWPTWHFSTETALVAAAFEALVLSAGLADRAASMGRQRDDAIRLASHDALTGALNRRALEERLATLLRVRRREDAISLLFADLDGFKRFNDEHGHVQGDTLLQAVVSAIQAEMRSGDAVARVGGDEFVIILPGTLLSEARGVADRVRRRIASLVPDVVAKNARAPVIGVSIGVAAALDDETALSLLERADQAMYAAKRDGGNRVVAAGGEIRGPEAVG